MDPAVGTTDPQSFDSLTQMLSRYEDSASVAPPPQPPPTSGDFASLDQMLGKYDGPFQTTGRPSANGPNKIGRTPQSDIPQSKFAQRQNDPWSCGQTSAAMSINMLTGKDMNDKKFAAKYGYGLYQGLQSETKGAGYTWSPYEGNFDPGKWDVIDRKTNLEGFPVIIGLNGDEFSPSGNGHIITIIGTRGNEVTFLDPATGGVRTTTRKAIEEAPPHPDGKFLWYPEGGPNRATTRSARDRMTVRARSDVIAQAHGLAPSLSAAQWQQESGMRATDDKGNILRSVAGALGVSQMLPGTIKEVAERHNLPERMFYEGGASAQMKFGALYMRDLLSDVPQYASVTKGSYARALAAYNWGIGNLESYKGGPLPEETRNYVANILTNSTGRDVSPEEAEEMVRTGSGPRFDDVPRQQRVVNDTQNFTDFVGNYVNAMAGANGSTSVEDMEEGARHFVSGLTFSLSELVPGMAPKGIWDKYKGSGALEDLALEIPAFAGMTFISELAAGAVGARALGMTKRGTEATAPFMGLKSFFGQTTPRLPNIVSPQLAQMPLAARYQTFYTKHIANRPGAMGTLGRMLLGRESQLMVDVAAYSSVFGIQGATEKFVEGMLGNKNTEDIVPEALSAGFQSAMLGMGLSLGIPLLGRAAVSGVVRGGKAIPGMAQVVEEGHPLLKGALAAGGTAAGAAVLGMDQDNGLVPATVGIAAALMSKGAPMEALGMLGKSGVGQMLKLVPETVRTKISSAVKGMWAGLEQFDRDAISSTLANAVGENFQEFRTGAALANIEDKQTMLRREAGNLQLNSNQLKTLAAEGAQKEAGIQQQIVKAQGDLQALEAQIDPTTVSMWDDGVQQLNFFNTTLSKLRANPADPSVTIPQGTDPAKYIQQLQNSRREIMKEMREIAATNPQLQIRDGLKRNIQQQSDALTALQNDPKHQWIKNELPPIVEIQTELADQYTRYADSIANTPPGQLARFAELRNLDKYDGNGRVLALERGLQEWVDAPDTMPAAHLDFLAERNLRALALTSPEQPAEIAQYLKQETLRETLRTRSVLSKRPMSRRAQQAQAVPFKYTPPGEGGATIDGPAVVSALLRKGDPRVAMDGAVDPQVLAFRKQLAENMGNPADTKWVLKTPKVKIAADGSLDISNEDLVRIRTAIDMGQTKIPVKVDPAQAKDMRKLLRAELRARSKDLKQVTREQIRGLKKLQKIKDRGEVPDDDLLSAIRTPTPEALQTQIVARMARENQTTIQDEVLKWQALPPDVKSQLEREELNRLASMWTGNFSPSALKAKLFEKELEAGVANLPPDALKRVESLAVGGLTADKMAQRAVQQEINAMVTPPHWTEANGVAQNIIVDSLVSKAQLGRYMAESSVKMWDALADETFKKMKLTGPERDAVIREVSDAIHDSSKLGELLRNRPEMGGPMAAYLEYMKRLELTGHITGQVRAASEVNYMLMSIPEVVEKARALGLGDESRTYLEMVQKRLRQHGSWSAVQKANKEAQERLTRHNLTREAWDRMSEDKRIERLFGTKLTKEERRAAVREVQELATDLTLNAPALSPGMLMRNKTIAMMSGERLDTALLNLSKRSIDTGHMVDGTTHAPLVIFQNVVKDGFPQAAARKTKSVLRNSPPGMVGRLMGKTANEEATEYVLLSDFIPLPRVKNPDGRLVPTNSVLIHPDAAHFIQQYVSTTEMSNVGKVWDDLNSLIRSSALMGSPAHHGMNIVTTQIANMITEPTKAVELIPLGFKLMESTDGPALVMNAVRNGLNLRVMENATRLVTKDIASAFGDDVADQIYGTKQGIFRTGVAALNPMDPQTDKAYESLGRIGKAVLGIPRGMLKLDVAMNRKMLFDSIEAGMVSGFYYRAAKMAKKMGSELDHLPPLARQRLLYRAAADSTNMLNGAIPHWWHSDKLRKAVYGSLITPSWFMAKAQGFLAALEPMLGITGARGRFAHLPSQMRQKMYSELQGTIVAGMAAFIGASQVMSYALNGHLTFADPDPKKWFHVRVGETYYTSPLFGYFREMSKMLVGSLGEQTVEPFFETMMKQLGPAQKVLIAEFQNKDPRTGEEIRGPAGTGVLRQIADSVSYAGREITNMEEIAGVTSSATLANLVGLGQDGPVKRLNGRQWFLRQFGLWDSDYEYPRVYRAQLEAKMGWYTKQLDKKVMEHVEAARKAQDPGQRERLMRRAVQIAFDEGIEVGDKELRKGLAATDGRLKMTLDRFENLNRAQYSPGEVALEGVSPDDPIMPALMDMINRRRELDYDRNIRHISDPGYKP